MRKRIGCRLIDDILKFGIRVRQAHLAASANGGADSPQRFLQDESPQHYPFETNTMPATQATARVYEQTDSDHSLAPYVPRPSCMEDDVVEDEVTVTTVEPTPNGSFSDLVALTMPAAETRISTPTRVRLAPLQSSESS